MTDDNKNLIDENLKNLLTPLQLIKFENPDLKNGELAKKMNRSPQHANSVSNRLSEKLEKLGYTKKFIIDAAENPDKYFIATRHVPVSVMRDIVQRYGTIDVLTETINEQRAKLMLNNDWWELLATRSEKMWRTYPFNLISWTFGLTSEDISSHTGYVNTDSETQMFLAQMWVENVVKTCTGGARIYDMLIMRYRDHNNFEQIGKKFNISQDRVRQLIAKAGRQLRHPSRSNKFCIVIEMIFSTTGEVNFADIISAYERKGTFKEMMCTKMSEQSKQNRCVLNKRIEELDLSIRSFNCLQRAGINTVEELATKFQNETPVEIVKSVRNLGHRSYDEICDVLKKLGYPISQ